MIINIFILYIIIIYLIKRFYIKFFFLFLVIIMFNEIMGMNLIIVMNVMVDEWELIMLYV